MNSDGTKAGTVSGMSEKDSNEKMASVHARQLAARKLWAKENKSDPASKASRQLDRAAQNEVERNAVVAEKKKKGDKSNTKPLSKKQRDALKDNKRSIRKNKPDLNKPDTDSGISRSGGQG